MKNNNGQMTLWVVIAIVLAIIILVFLELNKNVLPSSSNNNNDFVSSIKKCASDPAQEVIQKMLDQGGYINNTNYKVLDGKNISYICQNLGYYKTCINQHPLIIDDELKQIRDYISPIVDNCFNNLKADLEKQNYQVNMSNMSIDTSFGPNKLYIDINRKIDIEKNDALQSYSNYSIEVNTPLYDLTKVAIDVANNEQRFCYFEYLGYMIIYPRFEISIYSFDDATKIYTIKDRQTDKNMSVAVRSCALPQGVF